MPEVVIGTGATLVTPLGYTGSRSLERPSLTEPIEGVVSPVARLRGYLGILEIETINPTPHGRNIGIHGPLRDP